MKPNSNKLKVWLLDVSRGYSIPMSVLNWLVIFTYCSKSGGDFLYGLIALIGVVFAHMGVNVFDDVVDFLTKTPKQQCKCAYIENKIFSLKDIFIGSLIYFTIALLVGAFLTYKCGFVVAGIAGFASVFCLLYPKLNNFALGEIAVSLTFGPLLFSGIQYVMLGKITYDVILLSLPIAIYTVIVLMVHSFMDYCFDTKSGKKTLCVLAGSTTKAIVLIFILLGTAYISIYFLIKLNILSSFALLTLLTIPLVAKLYKNLQIYKVSHTAEKDDFKKNFALARNIGSICSLIIILSILVK